MTKWVGEGQGEPAYYGAWYKTVEVLPKKGGVAFWTKTTSSDRNLLRKKENSTPEGKRYRRGGSQTINAAPDLYVKSENYRVLLGVE